MYTLIAIIFIAELIIAHKIISLIMKFDRKVCDINECVLEFNPLATTFMRYVRLQAIAISDKILKVIKFINEQKQKTFVKIIFIIGINIAFILFNIRRIKSKRISNLAIALLDLAFDLKVL